LWPLAHMRWDFPQTLTQHSTTQCHSLKWVKSKKGRVSFFFSASYCIQGNPPVFCLPQIASNGLQKRFRWVGRGYQSCMSMGGLNDQQYNGGYILDYYRTLSCCYCYASNVLVVSLLFFFFLWLWLWGCVVQKTGVKDGWRRVPHVILSGGRLGKESPAAREKG
jgi:hypothetical protein